jgi:hypothetical protein
MEVTLQQATHALKEHFGNRVDAGREDGRDLMAEVLRERFQVTDHEAKKMVEALEHGHGVRWVEGRIGTLPAAYSLHPNEEPYADTNPTGTEQPTIPLEEGYWQL